MAAERPRWLHVLPGLAAGGAERVLLTLVAATSDRVRHHVLCLGRQQRLAAPLRAAGARVVVLPQASGWPALPVVFRKWWRAPPTALVGWLAHGNAVASCLRTGLWPHTRLVMTHHGGPEAPAGPWHRQLAETLMRRRMHAADCHLYASCRMLRQDAGWHGPSQAKPLPLGIDTQRFRPAPKAAAALRRRLGLADGVAVVGMLARYDPVKDHGTALAAFAKLSPRHHLLLMGEGMAPMPPALARRLAAKVRARVTVWPVQDDVVPVVQGLSALLLASRSEAMPRVVLEALACQIPVAATAVGDLPTLLAGAGHLAPPGNVAALTAALQAAVASARSGASGRESVQNLHSVDALERTFVLATASRRNAR